MNTEQARYLASKLEDGERNTDQISMEDAGTLLRFDVEGDIELSPALREELEWMVDAATIFPQ